jgi:hypothetical protein
MKLARRALALSAVGAVALCAAMPASALRCGSRVVDRGALDAQVLSRCGEPYWRTPRGELFIRGEGGPVEQRFERRIEDWYYNFGASRLVVRLRFIDGVLESEQTLGYGQPRVGGRCTAVALQRGLSEGELVLRCGAPLRRRTTYGDQILRDGYGQARVQPRPREEWLFERDDSRLLARVLLSDGRIEAVEDVRP